VACSYELVPGSSRVPPPAPKLVTRGDRRFRPRAADDVVAQNDAIKLTFGADDGKLVSTRGSGGGGGRGGC
jgi:hypothetical protein